MNTPKTIRRKRILHLAILGISLMFSAMQTQAQTRDGDEDEREENGSQFSSDLNQENFRSDFGTDNNQRSIDYSTDGQRGRGDQSNNFDIFGSNKEVPVYKFEEDQSTNNQSGNNGGIIINGGGASSNMGEIREGGNANMPSVSDPFKQGQTGVKTPRNMDAVPDNGDEPNDVPLDGGISILGLAAVAYGFRKFKTKN
jgi:hypothetical protein